MKKFDGYMTTFDIKSALGSDAALGIFRKLFSDFPKVERLDPDNSRVLYFKRSDVLAFFERHGIKHRRAGHA